MAERHADDDRTTRQPPDQANGHDEERPALVLVPGSDTRPEPGSKPTEDDGVRLRHVIGDTLRQERLRQGRTLAEVADEAAVSLPYLSEVERGQKEISSDLLHSVHHALGLELHDVLERATRRLELRAGPQCGRPLALAA